MKSSMTLILGAFLLAPLLVTAQTDISGNVHGVEGEALPLAHVHLFPISENIGSEPITSVQVSSDGTYNLRVPEPGFYRIAVTAVNHDIVSSPVIVEGSDETIMLDVAPPLLNYNRTPQELSIIGSWNGFNFSKAEPMVRQKDGTFTYTFTTDKSEITYQILNLANSGNGGTRSINAPGGNSYVYDGGGDYRSVMKVKPGKVTITVDPKMIPASTMMSDGMVTFGDELNSQLYDLDHLFEKSMGAFMTAAMKAREEGTGVDVKGLWAPFVDAAVEFLGDDYAPLVRQYAAVSLAKVSAYVPSMDSLGVNSKVMAEVHDLLPGDSPIWAVAPYLASTIVVAGIEDEAAQEKAIRSIVDNNPDRMVRAMALADLAMRVYMDNRTDEVAKYYAEMKENYGDIRDLSYYLQMFDPDKRIQKGKAVPAFTVALLDAKGKKVGEATNESMKGKYYMIDFWATWCGPCIKELPGLHQAYEKFHGPNFEVLSLSFDQSYDKVVTYRAKKMAMPWLHGFVNGGFDASISKSFEVSGIPKPILVNPDGIIVATETELRGEALEQTLARYLGNDGQASR